MAFFMTKHKAELEPFLRAHRDRLEGIATRKGAEIVQNLNIVKKMQSKDRVGDWAEILGRFAGGFTKAHH